MSAADCRRRSIRGTRSRRSATVARRNEARRYLIIGKATTHPSFFANCMANACRRTPVPCVCSHTTACRNKPHAQPFDPIINHGGNVMLRGDRCRTPINRNARPTTSPKVRRTAACPRRRPSVEPGQPSTRTLAAANRLAAPGQCKHTGHPAAHKGGAKGGNAGSVALDYKPFGFGKEDGCDAEAVASRVLVSAA